MFDMKSTGRKIALLRKEKNLTQMELADMLNISYQAVSNWERGETMPDVSKLPEIAQIFNTSIDDILGNQRSAKIIENIIEDNMTESKITVDDFKAVAPLLTPIQIGEVSKRIEDINNINDMIDYIPFVSKEVADRLVLNTIDKNYVLRDLCNVMPFISKKVADKIAQKAIENESIILDDFLPFVSIEYADKLVLNAIEKKYVFGDLSNVMPFVSKEVATKIFKNRF